MFKRSFLAITTLFLISMLITGCSPQSGAENEIAIYKVLDQFEIAMVEENPEALVSLFIAEDFLESFLSEDELSAIDDPTEFLKELFTDEFEKNDILDLKLENRDLIFSSNRKTAIIVTQPKLIPDSGDNDLLEFRLRKIGSSWKISTYGAPQYPPIADSDIEAIHKVLDLYEEAFVNADIDTILQLQILSAREQAEEKIEWRNAFEDNEVRHTFSNRTVRSSYTSNEAIIECDFLQRWILKADPTEINDYEVRAEVILQKTGSDWKILRMNFPI